MLTRLSLAVLAFFAFTSSALASSPSTAESAQARAFPAPPVRARAALVMDAVNGKVLAGYNAHLHLPMASTTKLMTALLALQMGSLDDRITVSPNAFNYEADATVMGLHPNQVVTLRDLLYGLLLPSGADAANAIAIHYAGSESAFVAMMNKEAHLLGMQDTHYADATGLSSTNHYTSAYDLAVLAQYVSYMPDLIKITSTRYYQWDGHTLTNVNHILFWYPGVDGLKPGYTDAAGICQVIDVRRDGRHIIAVLLNTPDLVIDARNLLNFGLQDFSWIQSTLGGDSPALVQAGVAGSQPYAYFPASGHYIRGTFWRAFQADGGLTALGYPRTEQLHEGSAVTQYFQNGALTLKGGKVARLPLGMMPVAAPSPAPGTATPLPEPAVTPTATPLPVPSPTATLTPGHIGYTSTAKQFTTFQQRHASLLGRAVSAMRWVKGYGVQFFAYGALGTDQQAHRVYLLPIGDRYLALRRFLPAHPGNVYSAGFAPSAMLKAIGWLPK